METNTDYTGYEELIFRVLTREASGEEVLRLRSWIGQSPENQNVYEQYRALWQISGFTRSSGSYQEHTAWENLRAALTSRDRKTDSGRVRLFKYFSRIAAVFIIAFSAGSLLIYLLSRSHASSKKLTYTEYHVPYGSKSEVILPDSSRVWLNSGTTLKYSNLFNQNCRKVYLSGEGFFDVSKNPHKPFLVRTTGVTVRVLGTAFNVKAYPDDKTIETTVQRGLVQVTSNSRLDGSIRRVLLHANQRVVLNKSNESLKPITVTTGSDSLSSKHPSQEGLRVSDHVNVNAIVSWKSDTWIIQSEDLLDLAVSIERRYNVHIAFADTSLSSLIFSGILRDESLEQVLDAISLSAPVTYKVNKKNVILYHKLLRQH